MCLTIPKEEAQTCFELTRPVWAAAILVNDIQSWDKEYRFTQTQDKPDMTIMTNGIWVLMQQHSIEIQEAKRIIRQKVKVFVAEILNNLEKIKIRQNFSIDSRRLIEAMQYMHSGNAVGIVMPTLSLSNLDAKCHPAKSIEEWMARSNRSTPSAWQLYQMR